ncbi:UDP-glucose 4-epimerase GalE [Umezawaea sp. NPDC059074]|uniref:UDP-glucose 4-epimerase GalE n=1 Tax=Umezawaea sp. NPDC059074 TaxID=3346716 RepID=UPI00367E8320
MKLLVTGGAGYIGSATVAALVAAGHEVEVLDDLSTGFVDNVPEGAVLHELPLSAASQVVDSSFDAVLHFAAKISVGESVRKPELYFDVNVRGTMTLLDSMRANDVKRLIFSSTGSMYAANGLEPLAEDAVVDPQNPYAASKSIVDMMLPWECQASGLGAVSLRYFNAAGASGHLGERHTPETHLIPMVLDVAAGKRDEFLLFGDDYPTPDGTPVRDYIHIEDLASAHVLALEAAEPGKHKVYNLGNGRGFSNLEVVEAVREVTGHPVPTRTAPRREGDAVTSVASAEKARTELGWRQAKPDLKDIIADAWEFHRSRP